MPRRASPHRIDERDSKIRRLEDDLFRAQRALVDLMAPEARRVLYSYIQMETPEDWYAWPDRAAEKIIALCTDVTRRTFQGQVYEERAKCPLCGDGPQSFYEGETGFKLPEGLRRHLVGYGNSHECAVFGAARSLGRHLFHTVIEAEAPEPNWPALRKLKSSPPPGAVPSDN